MIAMIMVRQILAVNENFRLNQKLGDANRQLRTKSTELVFTNQELQVQVNAHQIARERLSFEATHDQLTSLPNRTYLLNHLEPEIAYARDDPTLFSAIMFLDCDRFKLVNDSLGHLAGDTLLIQVAQRIRVCLRSKDIVARLGGDEFIVYLPETNGLAGISHVADRILEELRKPFFIADQSVYLSASIGIVDQLSRYNNPVDILRDADIAMYKAKELGKARYVFFNAAIGEEAYQRMKVERDLRQAIENHQFEMFYQPVINLCDESLAGFEALLRWNHPQRGLLSPGEFIPLAEQTGLIQPIGKWVVTAACNQFAAWLRASLVLPNWFVSVNVSSNEFLDPEFGSRIAEILAQTGLNCRNLRLEITESVFLADSEAARQTFAELTALGIECYLDDFGTGYSSLGYLHSFPIHTIKIDRTFVWSIDTSKQQDMIGAIMSVAKGLGLQTVAEGIETVTQLTLLKELGCRLGQGFLFYKPLPAGQIEALLREQAPGKRPTGHLRRVPAVS
jgi:diguanylate cyclase (GGDEF)-like protein